ncbi:MAG TPA: CBS domain-containing protein [Stellaceae bacterium]|nr:CBS domain-containing protein [Stellaceae bacterium]
MLVRKILATARGKLVVLRDDAPLIEAAKLLAHRDSNLVVICNARKRLVGVIAKTDIVRQMGKCRGSSCKEAVASVMTKEVAVCRSRDFLDQVWSVMKERGLKHIPVVDRLSRPIGLAIARDVLNALVEESQHEGQLMRDYIMCVGYH